MVIFTILWLFITKLLIVWVLDAAGEPLLEQHHHPILYQVQADIHRTDIFLCFFFLFLSHGVFIARLGAVAVEQNRREQIQEKYVHQYVHHHKINNTKASRALAVCTPVIRVHYLVPIVADCHDKNG